jgi:3-oxoacyl-[acyl-carrier protein] reductase
VTSELSKRRALVIGGSGGIGRAISVSLADAGAHVIVHGRPDSRHLTGTVAEIQQSGGSAEEFPLFLQRAEDILPHILPITDIDILVVAFGPIEYRTLSDTTADMWLRLTSLNIALPGLLVSHYLPLMVRRRWGRIVLFSGSPGIAAQGYREIPAYAAAKAGIATLCASAARAAGQSEIRVFGIAPEYVDTEYLEEEWRQIIQKRVAPRSLLSPEAVAAVVLEHIQAESTEQHGRIIPISN